MTLEELIISFSGTAVGGVMIGKWLNKKKDDLEEQLKKQVFYKTLILDINSQREIEQKELHLLKDKVEALTKEVKLLLNMNKDKDEIIESQRKNILRWEENCIRLEAMIEAERKENQKLLKQLK